MELMHNQVIVISEGHFVGMHRIILDEPSLNQTILVRLDPPTDAKPSRSGRPRLKRDTMPQRPPHRLFMELIWADREELERLRLSESLRVVEVEPESIYLKPIQSLKTSKLFSVRCRAMQGFLDFDNLRHRILYDHGLGGLVKEGTKSSGCSGTQIYKLFSVLCLHGFSERSLRPRYDRCGAPGKIRPCDPGGRKKPGRKTIRERIDSLNGDARSPNQPGCSTEWRNLVLAADSSIKLPKPSMPARCKIILNSSFVRKFKNADGKLIPVDPELGQYPNQRQIRRILEVEIPRLERLQQKTTKRHFESNMRGLQGKAHQGVSGPGHTWAMDSTIGDIYLCSSVNRAWIIGRPIVYVLIDVWSTAVVGFYVCLSGPSWDMARIALFTAAVDPALINYLWGYQHTLGLDPVPTMPASIWSDRGENHSVAGRQQMGTSFILDLSYAAPYRGDWKGPVEVLHRIEKDQQFGFIPGAIDARRKEFELRRFNPLDAVLTVREYTWYLTSVFNEYNLTANRDHRLDSHMRAAGVMPSPAGLWKWGHEMGIGVRRAKPQSELITTLLPTAKAKVTRNGVMMGGLQYVNPTITEQQWAAHARNFGGWVIPASFFPGNISRIWTPGDNHGMLELQLSDYSKASPEETFDEYADALAYSRLNSAQQAHDNIFVQLDSYRQRQGIVEMGKRLTADALEGSYGPTPTLTEARTIENASLRPAVSSGPAQQQAQSRQDDSSQLTHSAMLKAILDAANTVGSNNE